jgi:mono/diheme cytochrome c family protein|tara:strand:+ start:4481 stop:5254 length:774 start_codon:yes stop_codon:yes gene_type:complete
MADSSSSRDLRPDLDETINVPEAHAALSGGAAAVEREKSLRENGMEPVTLWLIMVSAVIVLAGGAVMGQGGAFFGYDELVKEGYMRGKSKFGPELPPIPIPALAFLRKEGGKVYSTCNGCHQASGAGQAGSIPPLAGSEWVNGNTEKLLLIIHNGIQGPIEVAGITYSSQMEPVGANYGPKEMAAVMTYIRTSWGNTGDLVSPEMAANGLEISKQRGGGKASSEELKKSHDKMLTGDNWSPDTLIDPETWEPVATEE